MKKNFSLLLLITLNFTIFAQTNYKQWNTMMVQHKSIVDSVLLAACPKGLEVTDFKHQIIEGKLNLSETSTAEILKSSELLKKYAEEFITKNNISVDSDDELLLYASFNPNFPINDNFYQTLGAPGLTADEIWDCAVDAVGLGFVSAIGAAGIKAADFGFCLYGQSLD